MQNELYNALLEAKKDNTQKLSFYIDSVGVTKLISDIENLLLLQREHAAEKATSSMKWEGRGYLQHAFPLPKWIPTKTPVVDKKVLSTPTY